jgi:hypothetical protein
VMRGTRTWGSADPRADSACRTEPGHRIGGGVPSSRPPGRTSVRVEPDRCREPWPRCYATSGRTRPVGRGEESEKN